MAPPAGRGNAWRLDRTGTTDVLCVTMRAHGYFGYYFYFTTRTTGREWRLTRE